MAYKQNGYRGNRTNSFKEISGITGVNPTNGGPEVGDTLTQNGKSFEVVSTKGGKVALKSQDGIVRISPAAAKKLQTSSKITEDMQSKASRVLAQRKDLPTIVSSDKLERMKEDIAKNVEVTPSGKEAIRLNKQVTENP